MALYNDIANQIALQIKNGHFKLGDRIYSRKELCEEFNTSGMTAVRAQNELLQMGIVKKVKGRGIFVTTPENIINFHGQNKLRRIIFFKISAGSPTSCCQHIFNGIEARAAELKINLSGEFISSDNIAENSLELPCSPRRDEGYIIISSGEPIHLLTGALLLRNSIKTVFVDSIMPGTNCVLTDNFSGMEQLVDYLTSKNAKKIIFAKKFYPYGIVNESERAMGYKIAMEKRGLTPHFVDSGNFNDLISMVNDKNSLDAIMFPQDSAAIKFKEIMTETGVKRAPIVTGFDDFTSLDHGLEKLTTVRVDRFSLGTAAVDLLVNSRHTNGITPDVVRIPCQLVIRGDDTYIKNGKIKSHES